MVTFSLFRWNNITELQKSATFIFYAVLVLLMKTHKVVLTPLPNTSFSICSHKPLLKGEKSLSKKQLIRLFYVWLTGSPLAYSPTPNTKFKVRLTRLLKVSQKQNCIQEMCIFSSKKIRTVAKIALCCEEKNSKLSLN